MRFQFPAVEQELMKTSTPIKSLRSDRLILAQHTQDEEWSLKWDFACKPHSILKLPQKRLLHEHMNEHMLPPVT